MHHYGVRGAPEDAPNLHRREEFVPAGPRVVGESDGVLKAGALAAHDERRQEGKIVDSIIRRLVPLAVPGRARVVGR